MGFGLSALAITVLVWWKMFSWAGHPEECLEDCLVGLDCDVQSANVVRFNCLVVIRWTRTLPEAALEDESIHSELRRHWALR
jgi:hypothetical protein